MTPTPELARSVAWVAAPCGSINPTTHDNRVIIGFMIAAKEDLIIDHDDRFKVLLNRTSEEHWATLDGTHPLTR